MNKKKKKQNSVTFGCSCIDEANMKTTFFKIFEQNENFQIKYLPRGIAKGQKKKQKTFNLS